MATGYQDVNKLAANSKAKQAPGIGSYSDHSLLGSPNYASLSGIPESPWAAQAREQRTNDAFNQMMLDSGSVQTGKNTWKKVSQIEDENAQNAGSASMADAFAQGQANQQGIMDLANQYGTDAQRIGQQFEAGGNGATLPGVDNLVFQNLRNAASGVDVPFGKEQQAALMTNANAGSQAATNNQLQQLQEQAALTGANPSDPSFQAAMRQAQSGAQANMQNQRNSIAMQAGTANYAAKQQATSGLTSLQGQLAGQALANQGLANQSRGNALQAYQSGTQAKQQALSQPVVSAGYDVQKGRQQGGGQQATKAGNFQLPDYQAWTNATKSNPWK